MYINKKIHRFIYFLLFLTFIPLAFTGCGSSTETETPLRFSCRAQCGDTLIKGFADTDTDWYLFVPSSEDISAINITYTGDVAHCDAGNLDSETLTISKAFEKSGDSISITAADGTVYTVTVMQSDLPSVKISLTGLTLEDIHRDKNLRAYRSSLNITDASDANNNLSMLGNVQFKGRGNSSWREYDKKGYQLTMPAPASVMGMAPGEKWLLLANSSDDSMLRNAVAFTLADRMDMAFAPDFRFVDLWIDGDYLGTYMLCEKITVESTRLNLTHRDGALFEHDDAFWQEEENNFYNAYLDRHFTLKETVSDRENTFNHIINNFDASVDRLMDYLYTTPSSQITLDSLSQYIDVDSFAKYYLVNEYLLNRESFITSFYWYQDGADDVLHLGPVWDFDTSMGVDEPDPSVRYGHNHPVMNYLLSAPRFYDYTQRLYSQYSNILSSLESDISVLSEKINISAEMNYIRWDALGSRNVKNQSLRMADSYDEAVDNLKNWLDSRYQLFSIPFVRTASSVISDDGKTMDIFIEDNNYTDMMFSFRHHDADPVLASVYSAEKDGNMWRASADLTFYDEAGLYVIDAATGGHVVATGRNYVPAAPGSDYSLSAQLADDKSNIRISMADSGLCGNVVFTIRNRDIPLSQEQHLQGYRDENGVWQHTVSPEYFPHTGTYRINAYSVADGIFTLVAADTVEFINPADYPVTADISPDGAVMTITMPDDYNRKEVLFAVWSQANSQDDIYWLTAVRNKDNLWQASINMSRFNDGGIYFIHAYEKTAVDKYDYLNDGSIQYIITKDPANYPVEISLRQDKSTVTVTMDALVPCTGVTFAVWGENSGREAQWFDAIQRNGSWSCIIDISRFDADTLYNIHAYEKTDGVLTAMLNAVATEV